MNMQWHRRSRFNASRGRTAALPLAVALIVGALALIPLGGTWNFLLILAMAYAVAGVGLDLVSGYLGQLVFCQAGFVAVGAYLSAIFRQHHLGPGIVALLVAVIGTGVGGGLLGVMLIRLRSFGIAAGTFFFAAVINALLSFGSIENLTGGGNGLPVLPLTFFGSTLDQTQLGVLCLVVLLLVVWVTHSLVNSRPGHALRVIKFNENVAWSLGIPVNRFKVMALAYSAAVAGLAGYLIAPVLGYLSPTSFDVDASVIFFGMLAVGGSATVGGAIIGATMFEVLPQVFSNQTGLQDILFAAIILVALILVREGLFGVLERGVDRLTAYGRASFERSARAANDEESRAAAANSTAADPPPAGPRPAAPIDTSQPPTGAPRAITVTDLTVRFGGVEALAGIGLTVDPGTVHAVIGPNGAGKTTLINCISGLQRPTSGSLACDGLELSRSDALTIRMSGIARSFQHASVVGDLSTLSNALLGVHPELRWLDASILAGRWARRRVSRDAYEAAAVALQMVGIPESRWQLQAKMLTLSEQKLLDIARALAAQGGALLLDEPGAGLSDKEIGRIAGVISQLKASRALSIVLVAHQMKFVRELADTVTVLNFGRVLSSGSYDEVMANDDVIEAFVGRRAAQRASMQDQPWLPSPSPQGPSVPGISTT